MILKHIYTRLGDILGLLDDVILGLLGDVILGLLGDVILGLLGDVILGFANKSIMPSVMEPHCTVPYFILINIF